MKSVAIGICAFNEEQNIEKLLNSIEIQSLSGLFLKSVYIISDGSTDNTVAYAKKAKVKNLTIIDKKKSLGKSKRLVDLFQLADEDILVLLDADTILDSKNAIEKLVEPISKDEATLVGGRPLKVNTKNFTDKALSASLFLQDYVKENLNEGSNIYACHGRIMALSKKLYKNKKLKPLATGNDAFIYLFNKKVGKFKYVLDANVWFKMPQTISDFTKQRKRYTGTKENLVKYFGVKVNEDYKVPNIIKFKAILKCICVQPMSTLSYIILVFLSNFARKDSTKAGWVISKTTKSLD